jgi:hypothetical protein
MTSLLKPDIRMEPYALQIASAIIEKLGTASGAVNEQFIHSFLYGVFQCMHFYKNFTKSKVIPISISRAIWSCWATFIIYLGSSNLMTAFDKIQQGILFMILNSEGEKIKYLTGPPPRERKYGLIAFSQLL